MQYLGVCFPEVGMYLYLYTDQELQGGGGVHFCSLCCVWMQDTFGRAKTWVRELQRQASPNIVIALAGNKADLANKRMVEYEVHTIPLPAWLYWILAYTESLIVTVQVRPFVRVWSKALA